MVLQRYTPSAAAWRPPFKCPRILGRTAENEARDPYVERNLDSADIFSGSFGLEDAAHSFNQKHEGFDREKVSLDDAGTDTGFDRMMYKIKSVRPNGTLTKNITGMIRQGP